MTLKPTEYTKFGDPALLEKIDQLFACNVGDYIDLPQLVVVGDQSSSKSSVLEGLTKLPFPQDSGLCTRFATQIVFRRAVSESIAVSILPNTSMVEDEEKLKNWRIDVEKLDANSFGRVMQEVHEVMGLSGQQNKQNSTKSTFSKNILWLEISGPSEDHLSVIDVPRIFKNTTPGVTTKEDIQVVRDMVQGFMENPRSIMLTVVPANVNIATQEIVEMAKELDPEGERTLGVLTKPDLVDKGAEGDVKAELSKKLAAQKAALHSLGEERDTPEKQSRFLLDLVTAFQSQISLALDANYEKFANEVETFGHHYNFEPESLSVDPFDLARENSDLSKMDSLALKTQVLKVWNTTSTENLEAKLHDVVAIAAPATGITTWLHQMYLNLKGFEIGTLEAKIISILMNKQSEKWVDLGLRFVSDVIIMVHDCINLFLELLCTDTQVTHELISLLTDELKDQYCKLIEHVNFLLWMKRNDSLMTLNHYFNDNLQKW
ncbi:hypothetical protein LOZ66_006398 [Ophidiomyces ophidiicola]|nr:hypothetical protein LOZ66_006398 [Ophidiomyces ophidiicola]